MNSINESIGNIRTGLLFLVVGSIVSILSLLGAGVLFAGAFFMKNFMLHFFILRFVIGIISLIFIFYSYINLDKGFKGLLQLSKDFNIGSIGALIILIGGIIFLITSFAEIIIIIGEIILGIGTYLVGSYFNNSNTKIGGILMAIPLIILPLIGFILSYIGLGEIVQANPIQYQPNQVSLYQVGMGILRNNDVYVTIFSSSQIPIISAEIQGTTYVAKRIDPQILFPGNNNVMISFDQLIISKSFNIILKLSNGQSLILAVSQ